MDTIKTATTNSFAKSLLAVATFAMRVSDEAPIKMPDNFRLFLSSLPEEPTLSSLIRSFQKVFSEPPWEEQWDENNVLHKITREAGGKDSFLVVMQGNENLISGFSWGALVKIHELASRVSLSIGSTMDNLEDIVALVGPGRIVYFDEFAILSGFRRGVDPVRFLLRPALELGYRQGVTRTIFWSTPGSRIVPLAKMMGYEIIGRRNLRSKEKEIIFLFHSNFVPMLKLIQHASESFITGLMARVRRKNT